VPGAASIDAYVEAHAPRLVDELKELLSFPSISVEGAEAVRPCREWLAERLSRYTERVEVLEEGGLPSLWAELPGRGPRRLLLYQHYDVQPVDPVELWDSPPFEPAERDGRIFARGIADDKADVMARIHAVEALRAVAGELPVSLVFLVEGEEEIGSRSFEAIVDRHRGKLAADGCLWESMGWDPSGRGEVHVGCRGLLYVQLRVRLLNFDQHSSFASIYPAATFCLVEALAGLRDQDMNIRIEGFYEQAKPPSAADRRLLKGVRPDLEPLRRLIGFDRLIRDPEPDRMLEQLLFTPTCNIAGLSAGYQGEGSMTVLPAEATAKLDFRLVPDQDPADIVHKLRRHLDSHGFEKVEIDWWDGERPARSDPASPIARTVVACQREMYGETPVWPFMQATGPMHPIVHGLGIPTVAPTGVARPDCRVHAPNENASAVDYLNTVRLLCRIFERFGAGV
jgi:acetylornithine deacetylase/succinyl-diaminopimelate desuccinylase-like protein